MRLTKINRVLNVFWEFTGVGMCRHTTMYVPANQTSGSNRRLQ